MKRSCIPALTLLLFAAITFSGCESPADTADLNISRSVTAADSTAIEPIAVSVTGMVVVIDGSPAGAGATAVAYQGIPYYVNGGELTEGATVTVSGNATPILEWDAAGNFRFYGYSVKDGKVTVNG